jgi:hypothetical protein
LTAPSRRRLGGFGAGWGALGVTLLLGMAMYRLTPLAVAAFAHSLTPLQWLALTANVVFMAYAEGYRGFQQNFSPRVAARTRYLYDHPNWRNALLAPVFVMAFYAAPRRRKIVSWSLTLGIIMLVLLVHQLDQPWRGIVDAGVVVGLTWGLVSFFYFLARAFSSSGLERSPEVA